MVGDQIDMSGIIKLADAAPPDAKDTVKANMQGCYDEGNKHIDEFQKLFYIIFIPIFLIFENPS